MDVLLTGSLQSSRCLLCTVEPQNRYVRKASEYKIRGRERKSVQFYLKFIWHVLLVERVQTYEFETLCHNVEGLVVCLGAQSHLISADLQDKTQKSIIVSQAVSHLSLLG